MHKKIKKVLLVLLIMSLIILNLTGCTAGTILKKNKEIKNLEKQIEALQEQNKKIQEEMADTTVKEVSRETSLQDVEGKNVPEFVTLDGKIIFPNKITHPTAREDVNNSYIQIGSRFRFTPSDNWLTRLDGTTLDVTHPSKIWGKLQAIAIKEPIAIEDVKTLLQSFYVGFPATTITYREMYINDKATGLLSSAPITVENKKYIVIAGLVQKTENAVLILFTYEDLGDGVQQELVDLLLKSGKVGDSSIKLE